MIKYLKLLKKYSYWLIPVFIWSILIFLGVSNRLNCNNASNAVFVTIGIADGIIGIITTILALCSLIED